MGRIIVWIMSLLFVVSSLAGAQEKNEIGSLSFVEVHPVVDSIHAKTQPMQPKGWRKHVYLDPKVILDLRDVKRTYAEVDSSSSPISYPVYIELTPDGSAKLSAYSKANIHTRIGIIVDRKLLAAPMIQGHIRFGLLPLPYSSSKEEAEQLVGEISKALMK